ncbi:MAG: acyl-CoA thioesterase [Pseudomonadota bacterium]
MYPIRRQILASLAARRMPPLAPGEGHVNRMRAMPWDIDPLGDLNNGRIITLTDVGRIALAQRVGLMAAVRRNRWGLAMAGSAPHYRKRAGLWQRLEFHSRFVGRDARFIFIEHSMFLGHENAKIPAFNAMCRTVITSRGRLVPTDKVMAEIGHPDWNPPLPCWVEDWAKADSARPWPPADMVMTEAPNSP